MGLSTLHKLRSDIEKLKGFHEQNFRSCNFCQKRVILDMSKAMEKCGNRSKFSKLHHRNLFLLIIEHSTFVFPPQKKREYIELLK